MTSSASLCLAFLLPTLSSCVMAQSHCATGETDHLTCRMQKSAKVLSICGSPLINIKSTSVRDHAWLQYRYGTLGAPELVFPSFKAGSLDAFAHEHHKTRQQLTFSRAGTTYTVFASKNFDTGGIFKGVRITTQSESKTILCEDETPSSTFFALVFALESSRNE